MHGSYCFLATLVFGCLPNYAADESVGSSHLKSYEIHDRGHFAGRSNDSESLEETSNRTSAEDKAFAEFFGHLPYSPSKPWTYEDCSKCNSFSSWPSFNPWKKWSFAPVFKSFCNANCKEWHDANVRAELKNDLDAWEDERPARPQLVRNSEGKADWKTQRPWKSDCFTGKALNHGILVAMSYVYSCRVFTGKNERGSKNYHLFYTSGQRFAESRLSDPLRIWFNNLEGGFKERNADCKAGPSVMSNRENWQASQKDMERPYGKLAGQRWYAARCDSQGRQISQYVLVKATDAIGSVNEAAQWNWGSKQFWLTGIGRDTKERYGTIAKYCQANSPEKLRGREFMQDILRGAWRVAVFATKLNPGYGKCALPNSQVWRTLCESDDESGCVEADERLAECMRKGKFKKDAGKCLKGGDDTMSKDIARIGLEGFLASTMMWSDLQEASHAGGYYNGNPYGSHFSRRGSTGKVVGALANNVLNRARKCWPPKMFERKDEDVEKFWEYQQMKYVQFKDYYSTFLKEKSNFAMEIFKIGAQMAADRGMDQPGKDWTKWALDRHAFVYCWLVAQGGQVITRHTFTNYRLHPDQDDWFGTEGRGTIYGHTGTMIPRHNDQLGPLARARARYGSYRNVADMKTTGWFGPSQTTQSMSKQVSRAYRDVSVNRHKFVRFWLQHKSDRISTELVDRYREFLMSLTKAALTYGWSDPGLWRDNLFHMTTDRKKVRRDFYATGVTSWFYASHGKMMGTAFQYMSLLADEFPCEHRRLSDQSGVVSQETYPDRLELLSEPTKDFPLAAADALVPAYGLGAKR